MGKLKNLQVVFDGNVDVFSQNDIIRGQIMMEVDSQGLKNVKGIWIRFRGCSKIEISGKNRSEVQKEDYFNSVIVVFGTAEGYRDIKNLQISPGRNSFAFQFQLPSLPIPAPLEERFGYVRYKAKATVSIKRTLLDNKEYHTKKLFSMTGPTVDLNAISTAACEAHKCNAVRSCCGLGCGVPIVITTGLPKQGYVPGETIFVTGHVDNRNGKTRFPVRVHLMQIIIFQFNRVQAKYRPYKKHTLAKAKVKVSCPRGQETGFVVGPLLIPPVPSSGLPGCNLIDIEYYVKVNDSERKRKFLLTIGTVPLRIRSPVPGLVHAVAPSAPNEQEMTATAPPREDQPPTYEEAVGVMDRLPYQRNREDYFTSETQFVPRYPYFNMTVNVPPVSH